jgi:hypothetical protein
MSMLSRFAVAALLVALPFTASRAQSVPDLSGTWVMDASKSDFGPIPGPTSRTDVITHKEPSLTVKRTQAGQMGDVTSTLVYGTDGKPYKNKIGDNEVTSTLKWDGQALVIESTVSTPNGDATIVDRYTLSADQKILTQSRKLSVNGQELSQTIVLVKQ